MTAAPQRRPTTMATVAANERGLDLSRGTHGSVWMAGQTTVDPASERPKNVDPAFDISDKTKTYFTAVSKPGRRGLKSTEAYAESSAWGWAGSAARSRGEPTLARAAGRDRSAIGGRPVVHEVEPVGNIDVDPNMGMAQHAEFTADKLLIKNTNWIRPPYQGTGDSHHDEIGVQGTLPHMNWNQFADRNRLEGMDVNNMGISAVTHQMKGTVEHDRALEQVRKNLTSSQRIDDFGRGGSRKYAPLRNDPYDPSTSPLEGKAPPKPPAYVQPQLNMLMR